MTALAKRLLSLLSFHPSRPAMIDPWLPLLSPALKEPVTSFVLLYTGAALRAADPVGNAGLNRHDVLSIILSKSVEPPQHEFLIIDTRDNLDGCDRSFVLERMAQRRIASDPNTGNAEGPKSAPALPASSSSLCLMEEGSSSKTSYPPMTFNSSRPSVIDVVSVTATDVAHIISDSLDKSVPPAANDRFLGGSWIKIPPYGNGDNANRLLPHDLKLFELAYIAHLVHELSPNYSPLKDQCYWFVSMVIGVVLNLHGTEQNSPYSTNDPESDSMKTTDFHTTAPQKSGRYMGFKITRDWDYEAIGKIVRKFKEEYPKEVNLCFF